MGSSRTTAVVLTLVGLSAIKCFNLSCSPLPTSTPLLAHQLRRTECLSIFLRVKATVVSSPIAIIRHAVFSVFLVILFDLWASFVPLVALVRVAVFLSRCFPLNLPAFS